MRLTITTASGKTLGIVSVEGGKLKTTTEAAARLVESIGEELQLGDRMYTASDGDPYLEALARHIDNGYLTATLS